MEADLKTPEAADVMMIISRASKTWSTGRLQVRRMLRIPLNRLSEFVGFSRAAIPVRRRSRVARILLSVHLESD
jgi:hypothetical protein